MALNRWITANDLYNYTKCLHKVYRDANADPAEKGEVSQFAKLLWEMGLQTERDYLKSVGDRPVTDLSALTPEAAWAQTLDAMKRGDELIYQGCLVHERMRGRPDLLVKHQGASNWGAYYYEPIDIKAGRGWEERDGKITRFKEHYAYQMIFYRDLLGQIQGYLPPTARIINVDQELEEFDPSEFEADYRAARAHVELLVAGTEQSEPVLGSQCQQCEWFVPCHAWAKKTQDPTLIYFIGQTKFGLKKVGVQTIRDVAEIDVAKHLEPPYKVARMGKTTLEVARRRARVVLDGRPQIRPGYSFPDMKREIYFDIEDDPTRAVTYLYGLLEVDPAGNTSNFRYFLAEHPDQEERAIREFWDYLARTEQAVYYVYSPKERTTLKKLRDKYDLDPAVYEKYVAAEYDLYQKLIVKYSDWPVFSYGIKFIAKQIGFAWRDTDPSGVNSIVWYNDFLEDPVSRRPVLERILQYNEDDCRAMVALKRYFVEKM